MAFPTTLNEFLYLFRQWWEIIVARSITWSSLVAFLGSAVLAVGIGAVLIPSWTGRAGKTVTGRVASVVTGGQICLAGILWYAALMEVWNACSGMFIQAAGNKVIYLLVPGLLPLFLFLLVANSLLTERLSQNRGAPKILKGPFLASLTALFFVSFLYYAKNFLDTGVPGQYPEYYDGYVFHLIFANLSIPSIPAIAFIIVGSGCVVSGGAGRNGLVPAVIITAGIGLGLSGSYFVETIDAGNPTVADISVFSTLFILCLAGACAGWTVAQLRGGHCIWSKEISFAFGATMGAGAVLQHSASLLPFFLSICLVPVITGRVDHLKGFIQRQSSGSRSATEELQNLKPFWNQPAGLVVLVIVNTVISCAGLVLWSRGITPRWP